jgi:hypothetical protein
MDLLGSMAAMSASRREVLSARPDAPVVTYRPSRWRTASTAVRLTGARALHGLADRLEPTAATVTPSSPRSCSSGA